jgi:hypothetical protein
MHHAEEDLAGDLRSATARMRARLRHRGIAICVSGIDGSGKTTLARRLAAELSAAGLPARHLHVYRWYLNVAYTPLVLLHNRFIGRGVLVFDRTIYRVPESLLPGVMRFLRAFYPAFDFRFLLYASLDETLSRRPDTAPATYAAALRIYRRIAEAIGFTELASDQALFGNVLSRM